MVLVFPVMISRMGAQSFGLWAALTAPTSMTALFGLGVKPAVVSVLGRSLGYARASAEDAEVVNHLNQAGSCARTGMVLSLVTAGVSVAVGLAVAGPIVKLLHVPDSQAYAALWLFRASSLCLGGMLVGAAVSALLDAAGRVDLDAAANGFVTATNAGFLLVAVLIQPSFRSLAWVSVATAATNVAAPAACLVGSGGTVLFRWGRLDLLAFRRLGRLAVSLGSVGAMGATVDPAVKWAVGALGGGLPVAAYELASRAILVISGSFGSLAAPLMPYYARTLTEHGTDHVTVRVTSASRLLVAVAFPTIALFAAASDALMRLWLGRSLPPGTVPSLEILAASAIAAIGMRASWAALIASGQGRRLLIIQIASVSAAMTVLALAAEHVLPLSVAAATAYASYTLLGGVLTLVQYGRTFGKAAAYDVLRSARHGLLLAAVATPIVLASRIAGTSPVQQVAVAALVWLGVIIHLLRGERQLRSLVARVRRGHAL